MQRRDVQATRATLATWLADHLPGARELEVGEPQVPGAGASNETMLFTVWWRDTNGRYQDDLVLRMQAVGNQLFLNPDVFFQWQMMAAIHEYSDIPVPTLRWREPDPAVLGSPFFVMDQVSGEVPNGYDAPLFERLQPDQVTGLYRNAAAMLARVHLVDWRPFTFLVADGRPPGLEGYLASVGDWYEWARAQRHFDYMDEALRYLDDHRPADAPVSILWGDSRPGNMIVDPSDQTVRAVLDWEIADLGTPEADMGWWLMFEQLFRERAGTAIPSGVPSRDDILTDYEAALGRPLRDVHYHDVLAWTRFAITCIRHVDVEQGSASETMFKELNEFVIDNLRRLLQGRDR